MDQPDLTRHQVVDRFYYSYGFNVVFIPGEEGQEGDYPELPTTGNGFCGLEWQPLPDGRLLVIAYEHPDNPGRSVTNAAEDIVEQFTDQTGIEMSRVVWAESYAAERPSEPVEFDQCTFQPAPGDKLKPSWRRMTAADWNELGIARPTVPQLARKQLG